MVGHASFTSNTAPALSDVFAVPGLYHDLLPIKSFVEWVWIAALAGGG